MLQYRYPSSGCPKRRGQHPAGWRSHQIHYAKNDDLSDNCRFASRSPKLEGSHRLVSTVLTDSPDALFLVRGAGRSSPVVLILQITTTTASDRRLDPGAGGLHIIVKIANAFHFLVADLLR